MQVEYGNRIDDETITCVVRWAGSGNRHMRMVVPVKATFDEVPEPAPLRDPPNGFDLQEAPRLSKEFKLRAVWAAQEMAREFSDLEVTSAPMP